MVCQAPSAGASPQSVDLGETVSITGECFGENKSGTVTMIPSEGGGGTTLDVSSNEAQSISTTYTPEAAGDYQFLIDVEGTQVSGSFSVAEPEEPTEEPTEERDPPATPPTHPPRSRRRSPQRPRARPRARSPRRSRNRRTRPPRTPTGIRPRITEEPTSEPAEPDGQETTPAPGDPSAGDDGEQDDETPGFAGTLGPDAPTPSPVAPSEPSSESTPSNEGDPTNGSTPSDRVIRRRSTPSGDSPASDEPAPSAGGAGSAEPTDASDAQPSGAEDSSSADPARSRI